MSAWLFHFFYELKLHMIPGMTGTNIVEIVEKKLTSARLQSAILGYQDFPALCCISKNHIAAHGIPDAIPFKEGDIITIDLAVTDGYFYADGAWTYLLGKGDKTLLQLISAAWRATLHGCQSSLTGKMVGDITRSAQDTALQFGYQIPQNCYGHGIGTSLHTFPRIPFVTQDPLYLKLRETPFELDQMLNIEPILFLPTNQVKNEVPHLIPTAMGLETPHQQPSAQFELTVVPLRTYSQDLTSSILTLPGINPFDPRIAKFPPFF